MRRDVLAGLLASVPLFAARAEAQALPDFSGRWTLVPEARPAGVAMGSAPATLSAPGTMGSGWASELTLAQDASTLTVEYTYFHPRDVQPPFRLKYLLDGALSTNTINMGRGPQTQLSKIAWEGTRLVITTEHSFVNPQDGKTLGCETKQMLSLASATSLVVETVRCAVLGGKASSTRSVYERHP